MVYICLTVMQLGGLLCGLASWSGAAELAPARIPLADGQTRAQVRRLEDLLQQQQEAEAIDRLRQLVHEQGDELLALDAEEVAFQRHLPLREYLHRWLATLADSHPAALARYRSRVDPLAESWLHEGRAARDRRLVQQVIDQLGPSRWEDEALLALGELALERREYGNARAAWRRIHPALAIDLPTSAAGRPWWLAAAEQGTEQKGEPPWQLWQAAWQAAQPTMQHPAFPDSDIPLAEIRARLILVSLLEGNLPRAEQELQAFARWHPEATGRLAGKRVSYLTALQQLLRQAAEWPASRPASDWPTFAGAPDRQRRVSRVDVPLEPAWRVPLTPVTSAADVARPLGWPEVRSGETYDQPCSHFPIVVDRTVLVAEQDGVRAFQLSNGQPVPWAGNGRGQIYPPQGAPEQSTEPLRAVGVPRWTLSAAGSRVVARLGSPLTYRVDLTTHLSNPGELVVLDLDQQGRLVFPRIAPPDPAWAFDGVPVLQGQDLFGVLLRSDVVPEMLVVCFRHGKLHWQRRIASSETPWMGQRDAITSTLLTLAEGTLYLNTNLGVVAALSAEDGTIRWITRYPRAAGERPNLLERPWYRLRDLNPCVYHQGRLYVAPADYDGIFCLDATSGSLLWQTQLPRGMLDAVHLLGVAEGQLVASGRRLWWFDCYTGELSRRVLANPFPASVEAPLTGMGRGVVAQNLIYWPVRDTVDRILVLDLHTGRQVRQPIQLGWAEVSAGNLVVVDGYLLVAGPRELVAFSLDIRRER